jgi:hypothetical protein
LAQRNAVLLTLPDDSPNSAANSLSGALASGNIGNVAASLLPTAAGAIMKGLNIGGLGLGSGGSSQSSVSKPSGGGQSRDSGNRGGIAGLGSRDNKDPISGGSAQLGPSNFLQLQPSSGPLSNNSNHSGVTSPLTKASSVPAHPAGVCLEVLLSFFVSAVPHALANGSDDGCLALCKALTNTIMAVSQLISSALSVEGNVKDFENAVKGSQLITLLEGLLTGAETDIEYVSRAVHEHLVATSTAESSEVLVLAFQVLQVSCRLLISFALETLPQTLTLPQVSANNSPRAHSLNAVSFSNTSNKSQGSTPLSTPTTTPATPSPALEASGSSQAANFPVTISFEPSSPSKKSAPFAFPPTTPKAPPAGLGKGGLSVDTNSDTTNAGFSLSVPPTSQVHTQQISVPAMHGGSSSRRYSTIFFSPQVFTVLPDFFPADRREYIRSLVIVACDNAYDSVQDACIVLLSKVEYAAVIRRSLGVLAELSLASGLLGLPRISDWVIATLCKYTVPSWHGADLSESLSHLHSYGSSNELRDRDSTSSSGGGSFSSNAHMIRWRHMQAQVRMLQVLSVLSDAVTDWDCVVDALDQVHRHYATKKFLISEEVSISEVEKVFGAIDRFKKYSIFLSNDSLVRLMTSLVALSLNTLAVGATSLLSGGAANTRKRSGSSASASGSGASGSGSGTSNAANSNTTGPLITGPSYMLEGLQSGFVSFSLEAVVHITKLNAHRVSSVWQMVTSHLRMIASLKQPMSRQIAVASTHDIISSAIEYLDSSKPLPISTTVFQPNEPVFVPPPTQSHHHSANASTTSSSATRQQVAPIHLSDQLIYTQILPSFEQVFVPRALHKECLAMREMNSSLNPELSQLDLLSSLKSLSFIRYEDVRMSVLTGLLQLLMTRGHLLTTGWPAIIELLASVPAPCVSNSAIIAASSVVDEVALNNQASGYDEDDQEFEGGGSVSSYSSSSGVGMSTQTHTPTPPPGAKTQGLTQTQILQQQLMRRKLLPRTLLFAAFDCAKYIADEFLHSMSIPDVKGMIGCFAIFAAQSVDLNISLSAVELLWRVCDSTLFRFKVDGRAMDLADEERSQGEVNE